MLKEVSECKFRIQWVMLSDNEKSTFPLNVVSDAKARFNDQIHSTSVGGCMHAVNDRDSALPRDCYRLAAVSQRRVATRGSGYTASPSSARRFDRLLLTKNDNSAKINSSRAEVLVG